MLQASRSNLKEAPQSPGPGIADGFPGSKIITDFCDDHRMTPRERQILAMICRGMMNERIGEELRVSNATIRLHIGNIHRKLHTRSKVDLVLAIWRWCCRTGRSVAPLLAANEHDLAALSRSGL